MRRLAHSIQARVLALVLAAAVLLFSAVALFSWLDIRHELDELLDAHLSQSAALLVAQDAPELEDERGIDAPVLHRYAPRVAFQVFHEGRLALRSLNAPSAPMLDLASVAAGGFRTVRIGDEAWRLFATRGAKSDVLVIVAEQAHARSDILGAILRTALGPLLIGTPLLALALWWSVRRGLTPMNDIGRALAARSADDFSPVVRGDAPMEMRPMLDALDSLFTRIATLMEGERRFTADAAHELRTPLAGIRAQAQVALRESDPARRQHALAATLEGCDRASRLVDQLLALSRLDALARPAGDLVEIRSLVRDVLASAGDAAIAKRQDLRLDATKERLDVRGDAALLAVLVRNLVDNAIRYAPNGAAVEVSLRPEDGRIALTVENSGAAPPPEDLARLGERFFRVLGTAESGSGLGLSIVRRIAQLHAAVVELAPSAQLGGLRARVTFPAAT